jgi:Tfp pilus assembly protein PilF
MSLRQSRGYKIFLVVLSLVFLAGAGYLGYRTFFHAGGSAGAVQAAEQSYKQGADALANNPQEAAVKFDSAAIAAEKGLNAYATEVAGKTPDPDQLRTEGKLNWALAKAIRERAYAKAKQEGKPLDEPTDATSGQAYRNFYAIPDGAERSKAVNALIRASELIPDDPEVLLESTRVVLSSMPLNWTVVERLMKETLKANPKDPRANYFLAKFEFDQPQTEAGVFAPRPADKKDNERVDEALKLLKAAEENKAPYWRVAHLKADVLSHQLAGFKDPSANGAKAKAGELDALLFDAGGALDKAAKGEHLSALSVYDGTGFVAVHEIAMKRATAGTPDAAKVKRVAESTVVAAAHLGDAKGGTGFVPLAGEAVLDVLLEAKRVLKPMDPQWWKKVTAEAEAYFAKHPAATTRPGATGKRVQLADNPAAALKVLTDGVEAGRKANMPAAQLSDLLAELVNMKLLANAPAAEVEPMVKELQGLNAKEVAARVSYLGGVLSERQGKLKAARDQYNKVLEDKELRADSPLTFLTNLRLGPVCLASGEPGRAAGHLEMAANKLRGGGVSAEEKAWVEQAGVNADEVTALQVVATVRAGIDRIALEARRNPGQPIPGDFKRQTESTVNRLMGTLRPPSNAHRTAHLAMAEYQIAVRDRTAADKALATLAADYPSDIPVLRASVARIMLPEEGKKEPEPGAVGRADLRIDQFLKANPDGKPGKLFKAEWLIRTRRADEAVAYLKKPENFPDHDEVVKRLLAGALLQAGNREEAKQVLGQLPPDVGVELAVIQAAGSKEEAEKGLKAALSKYENNGLLRLYDGVLKLNDGKHEAAAEEFQAATEFTAVGPAATALLQRALMAYAGADRKKAAPYIHTLIDKQSEQMGLYQAAALVAKYTDDIGQPGDAWGPGKKSMYAAVNQWAILAAKANQPPEAVGMVKAAYHELAGSPLLARQEALRALSAKPTHVPALLYLAQSYMFGASPDLAEAKKYIDRADAEAKADNPAPSLLKGVWLERTGKADEAAKLYEFMMTQYAGSPAPYARRVEVAANAKKPGEAVDWAKKWVEKLPEDGGGLTELVRRLAEAGEVDTAVKTADEWAKKQLDKAKESLAAVKPPLAADEQEKRLADLRAGINLATSSGFFRAKKYAEAKARVDAVLKDAPDSGVAQMMAADIAMAEKNWDAADKIYRERLKKTPDDFISANNLAWMLCEYKGNPAEAVKLMDHARLSGNDTPVGVERLPADFLETYGRVYLRLNDKDKLVEMEKMFEGAVKRYPDDPRLHRLLGECYAARGSNAKAANSLTRAIELAGNPAVLAVPEDQKAEAKLAAEAAKAKLPK